MANPTTNVLALLELLQNHELISGRELARQLNIEPRTVRRYIQSLEMLGIPVVTERGCDGGYSLMNGYKLPPMMFTNDEALALGLGLVATRNMGLATNAASHSASAKLERVMPESMKRRLKSVGASVAFDFTGANSSSDPEILVTLSAATRDQQSVRLVYCSQQQSHSSRQVDPYGLAYYGGKWYLVGYCHLRKDIRSFRLDRIVTADLMTRSFGKPPQFDAIAFIANNIATIPRKYAIQILLRTSIEQAYQGIFTAFGVLEVRPDGTLLTIHADDLNWVARELARLPFGFTIIAPTALRDACTVVVDNFLKCVNSQI